MGKDDHEQNLVVMWMPFLFLFSWFSSVFGTKQGWYPTFYTSYPMYGIYVMLWYSIACLHMHILVQKWSIYVKQYMNCFEIGIYTYSSKVRGGQNLPTFLFMPLAGHSIWNARTFLYRSYYSNTQATKNPLKIIIVVTPWSPTPLLLLLLAPPSPLLIHRTPSEWI